MNHSWIRKNIIRFIDNDLSESEKKDFNEHLSKCDFCNTEYKYVASLLKEETKNYSVPYNVWLKINKTINSNRKEFSVVEPRYAFERYSFVLLLLLSIMAGTFFGNKLLFNDSNTAKQVNLTEEYYPSDNIFKSEISGLGR